MRATAAILVVILTLSTFSPQAAAEPATTQSAHTLTFTVINAKTKEPVAGALLKVSGYQAKASFKSEHKTDSAGVATIPLPAREVRYLNVAVRAGETWCAMRANWPERGVNAQKTTLPDEFVFPVEPGTPISGQVVDDAGQPVAGATVKFSVKKTFSDPHIALDIYEAHADSDAQGQWKYPRMPAEFDSIEIGAWHHQYATERGYWHNRPFEKIAQLRDGSAKLVLERGVKIEGTVFDSNGKPLKNAAVGVGADRVPSNVLPEQKTDDNGKFTIGWKPRDVLVITVKAKGHAPELQQLTVAEDQKPLEFHLLKPRTLQGRVVDASGKPIAGVSIYTDTWRGCRTLDTRLTTDKEGRFTWNEAPADAVQCDIYNVGYADKRNTPLTATGVEQTITLNKPLKVAGTVIDAETNEPIKKFDVVPGITFDNKRISWQRRQDQTKGQNGKFEYEQTYPYPGYAARIEAPGYLPQDSRIFRMEDGQVTLEFKMKKGTGIGGIVKGADGKPVAGVKIIVATLDQTAYLYNGTTVRDQGNVTAETDAAGRYSLPPLTGSYTLVATHNAGYAELSKDSAEKSGDITLTPWARIEGNVIVSGKPAPKSEISVSNRSDRYEDDAPRIHHQVEAISDAAGNFVIERVRPGKLGVSRTIRIPMSAQSWMSSPTHSAVVDAQAGQTAKVQLGGNGRPVVGRVSIPPQLVADKNWRFTHSSLSTARPKPPEIPADVRAKFKDMTPDERKKWQEEWNTSAEVKAFNDAQKKASENYMSYALIMQPDGQFRADDVPAGAYDLMIQAAAPDPNSTCGPGETLAAAAGTITVPAAPNGAPRTDEPFEAGTLELKYNQTLKVGDTAPAIVTKTLDGKDLKLDDFKGKYVVIDFWATWCGPCVAEMPNLKSVYEAFAANPKFAMISLSLDEKVDEPKKFVETNGLKWTQGFLGSWSEAKAPTDYGVRGIPSVWLIGPDGKVLAKNLRGAQLKAELEKVLR